MKTITVHIKQLGAIKDSSIEISPVMLFSGESGLGKSYLAMLCHYFFYVLRDDTRINRYIESKGWNFSEMRNSFRNTGLALTISKKDFEEWLAGDCISYLQWMLNNEDLTGDLSIQLPTDIDEDIEVRYEEEILGLVGKDDVYLKLHMLDLTYRIKDGSIETESPFAFLFRFGLIHNILEDFKNLEDCFVFPPSRGPMLTEEIIPKTGLYDRYKETIHKIGRVNPHPETVSENLKTLLAEILEGKVDSKDGKYLYSTPHGDIPISAAAASVREIAPLALLVERTDISKVAMLIEEPEAHLHPIKQRMIADIISFFVNAGTYMQITTHSDYFLRRLNELINLKKISQRYIETPDKYIQICDSLHINPALALDYDKISAYLLTKRSDGTTQITKQDIDEGVPFASFTKAIDDSLCIGFKIQEYLTDETA